MLTKTFTVLSTAAALLLTASASRATGWTKVEVSTLNGTKINVDAQVNRPTSEYSGKPHTASPAYVNVRNASLTPQSTVHAVINDYDSANGQPKTYVIKLRPSQSEQYGFHFTGELGDATVTQNVIDQTNGSVRAVSIGTGAQAPLVTGVSSGGNLPGVSWKQDVATQTDGQWQKGADGNNIPFYLGLAH